MDLNFKQKRTIVVILIYPFAIFLISTLINLIFIDINTIEISMPSKTHLYTIISAALILTINHSLLMTTTEITRVKFKMYATPEEWDESGLSQKDTSEPAIQELERNHNAHQNLTENTCFFIVLLLPYILVSPPITATIIWLLGFAVARLGHTLAYLTGSSNLRGLFMSLSLLAMYGMASYLIIAWTA